LIVSKAAPRSSNTSRELALLSMLRRRLFTTLVTAVSVEYRNVRDGPIAA